MRCSVCVSAVPIRVQGIYRESPSLERKALEWLGVDFVTVPVYLPLHVLLCVCVFGGWMGEWVCMYVCMCMRVHVMCAGTPVVAAVRLVE